MSADHEDDTFALTPSGYAQRVAGRHRHEYKKLGRITTTKVDVSGTWVVFCKWCLHTEIVRGDRDL